MKAGLEGLSGHGEGIGLVGIWLWSTSSSHKSSMYGHFGDTGENKVGLVDLESSLSVIQS